MIPSKVFIFILSEQHSIQSEFEYGSKVRITESEITESQQTAKYFLYLDVRQTVRQMSRHFVDVLTAPFSSVPLHLCHTPRSDFALGYDPTTTG